MLLDSAVELRNTVVSQLTAAPAAVAYAADSAAIHQVAEGPRVLYASRRTSVETRLRVSAVSVVERRRLAVARTRKLAQPAIGIARSSNGKYQLAVRVTQKSLMSSELVEKISHQASGEVQVRVTGRIFAHSRPTIPANSRQRPLQIGSSIGQGLRTGTLGCFVQLNGHDDLRLLSANHVLADTNRARVGTEVLQPGPLDGGKPVGDVVGHLSNYVKLASGAANSADVAACTVTEGRPDEPGRFGNKSIAGLADGDPHGDETVEKLGRTTGLTKGKVSAFGMFVPDMLYPGGVYITLGNQIEINGLTNGQPFSEPGDSGALVVISEGYTAFAQLNGGDEDGSSFASPLSPMLDMLGATLVV